MGKFLGKMMKRVRRLTGRIDRYHEVITFAEAGQPEQGGGRMITEEQVEEAPRKLLVMGRESTFSREVIDYALEMAQRMSYEILALNTAPFSCETFKIFSSSRKQLCREFRGISEENVRAFQEKAEKLGIPFSHVVRFSETDEALEELKQEYKDIEFVVSEAEEDQGVSRVEDGERPRQEIFVYSLV